MTLERQHALALACASLCLLAGHADAGLNPGTVEVYQYNASATPASQSADANSDPIRGLTFDFSGTTEPTAYAALKFPVTSRNKRDKLAVSVRGAMTHLLSVEAVDPSGNKYTLPMVRTGQPIDDDGWSRYVMSLAPLGTNAVAAVKVVVRPTALNKKGTVYVRSVTLLDGNNAQPSTADVYGTPLNESSLNVPTSLSPVASYTGDDYRSLAYTFGTGSSPAVGLKFSLPSGSVGSYVRFKTNVEAAAALQLQLTDSNNNTWTVPVDRSRATVDAQGWSTHSVNIGVDGMPAPTLNSIRIKVFKMPTSPASGTAYFKDLDLLDQNPSPYRPLHNVALLGISSVTAASCNTCVAGTINSTPSGNDVIRSTQFRLAGTGMDHSGITLLLASPQQFSGKVIRFLAKVPRGYFLEMVLKDSAGEAHELRLTRQLSVINDDGWVEYATKVEPSDTAWGNGSPTSIAPSSELRFLLRVTGSNGVVEADSGSPVEASFKGFRLDDSLHALDLRAGTQATASWKPVDDAPLLRSGVGVSGLSTQDYTEAQQTSLKWARIGVEWGAAQTGTNTFNFNTPPRDYRGRILGLLSRNMNVVVVLAYNHPFYASNAKQGVFDAGASPSARPNTDAFIQYVTQVANMVKSLGYSGSRVVFEIWNEQDDPTKYWMGDTASLMASHYGSLLAAVVPVITGIDPQFRVISGGLAQPTSGSQFDLVYLKALAPYLGTVDAIAYHPYDHNTPEFKAIETARMKTYLSAQGVNKPLWITETGTSSAIGPAPANAAVDGTLATNRQKQARVSLRHMLASWGSDVPVYLTFTLRDWWSTTESTSLGAPAYSNSYSEHNFGLLDKDHGVKPARQAIGSLVAAATGRKLQGLVNGSESRIQAMKFAALGAETVYVVWSSYATPGETSYFTTPLNCNLAINLAGQPSSGSSCVTDMVGTSIQSQCVAVEPTSPTTYRCPISEAQGPVFVRVSAP